jgi:DNA-binding transcriptional ArsR family regulator
MPNPNSRDVRAVSKALAEPVAADALERLVDRGCDREELIRLLGRLRHANVAQRRVVKKLKRLARTLERAASGIRDLPGWQESRHLGLPDDAEVWLHDCSHDLQLLAEGIRARLARGDPDSETRIDHARNGISRHVLDRTGQPNDAEVVTLIDAVLGAKTLKN